MPQKYTGLADYHVHPNTSDDTKETATFERYVERAIELGLKAICFTPHVDLNPARVPVDRFWRKDNRFIPLDRDFLQFYMAKLEALRNKYSARVITIKSGLEMSYGSDFEAGIRDFIEGFAFDYIIGSIHCIDNVALSSSKEARGLFVSIGLDELAEKYFRQIRYAVDSGIFDSIGHFDGYKKYGLNYYGPEIFTVHGPYVDKIFELMRERDVGLEINTSAIKKGHKEFYPSRVILEKAYAMGVKVAGIGSDAHRPDDLAFQLDRAYKLANELGFQPADL